MNSQLTPEAAQAAKAEFFNKVWTDEAFAVRLESDPKSVLAEMGGHIPDNLELRVVRDTETVKHLHIPAAPSEGEISDGDLLGAQGGTGMFCASAISFAVSFSVSFSASYTAVTKDY